MSSMPSTIEHSQLIEIDAGNEVYAVAFTANGEYLITGGWESIQMSRVSSGRRVWKYNKVKRGVECVTVSKDGRWMAAGSWAGEVWVWDWPLSVSEGMWVYTDKKRTQCVYDVDFSPDASRLVSADGHTGTATVLDVIAHRNVQKLYHSGVKAAKYSPQGQRIATASNEYVWIWNNDGELLANIKDLKVEPEHGLLWHNNHLFIKTRGSKIKQIGAATGATISEWSVPLTENASCIATPPNGEFLAYVAKDAITFWSTSTHIQLGSIERTYNTSSIALSPNHQRLAICARNRKIILKELSFIKEPEIRISGAAFQAWKLGQLTDAEALLTAATPLSPDVAHHQLASRALIRARLQKWDIALADAKESIRIQPSLVGYIAKCLAIVGKGDIYNGLQVCDIAFHHFHSEHVSLLLLIKTVALFLAGEHDDAISLLDNLITDGFSESPFYVVLAYMLLHKGNLRMENRDYESARQSFEDAGIKLGSRTRPPPLIVSLISGWKFNDLAITIQQRRCEALLAAGRAKEASEYAQDMRDTCVKTWVSDFKSRCRDKLEELGDVAVNAKQYDEAIVQYTASLSLDPATPQNLLAKRSEAYAGKKAQDAANEAVKLDPPSLSGERDQIVRSAGAHSNAADEPDTKPSKTTESYDPETPGPSTLDEPPSIPASSDVTSTTRKSRTARLIGRLGKKFGGRSTSDATPHLT